MSSTPALLVVAGKIDGPDYHISRTIAEYLAETNANVEVELFPLLEADWEEWIRSKAVDLGHPKHRLSPLVFYNGVHYIGGTEEFADWASAVYKYTDTPNTVLYRRIAAKEYRKYLADSPHSFAFFDVSIGGNAAGRIVFELFTDLCPKTCANFLALCCTSSGEGKEGSRSTYEGSPIHRVVKGGWVQGGDVVDGSGANSEGAIGGLFADESFAVKQDKVRVWCGCALARSIQPCCKRSVTNVSRYVLFPAWHSFYGQQGSPHQWVAIFRVNWATALVGAHVRGVWARDLRHARGSRHRKA